MREREGEVFFLLLPLLIFFFPTSLVSDPRTQISNTARFLPSAVSRSLYSLCKIPSDENEFAFVGRAEAFPLHLLPPLLISYPLLSPRCNFTPYPAVNLPPSYSRPLLLSPPPTATSSRDGWITPEEAVPLIVKRRDNWSFSLIGSPDSQHQGGCECADSYERQRRQS